MQGLSHLVFMKRMDKLINKIQEYSLDSEMDLTAMDFTFLRKNIFKSDFRNFELFLKWAKVSGKTTVQNQIALRVLYLAPKYLENNDNLAKFQSLLGKYRQDPTFHDRAFRQMAAQILYNKLIKPEEKFFFLERGKIANNPEYLDLEFIEYGIKELVNAPVTQLTMTGSRQIIQQSLSRGSFSGLPELSQVLVRVLNYNLQNPAFNNSNEELLKLIWQSPHVANLSDEVYLIFLKCWQDLVNQSQIKFDHNNHHQTKKRLIKLKDSYVIMRDKFRQIRGTQNDDILAQLDYFLLG